MERRSVMGIASSLAAMIGLSAMDAEEMPDTTPEPPVRHLTFGRKKMKKDVPFNQRLYRFFTSPGRVVAGRPRPTAESRDAALNQVNFTSGAQLIFSDGSFRNPGRRRLLVLKDGQPSILSGRQLRKLRKRTRAIFKATAQQQVAASA